MTFSDYMTQWLYGEQGYYATYREIAFGAVLLLLLAVVAAAYFFRKPVVVTENGGPRYITSHGEDGFVVYANPRGSTSYGQAFGNLIHHAYPGDDFYDLNSGVDAVIAKQRSVDPDLWVIELEDARGRHLLDEPGLDS